MRTAPGVGETAQDGPLRAENVLIREAEVLPRDTCPNIIGG